MTSSSTPGSASTAAGASSSTDPDLYASSASYLRWRRTLTWALGLVWLLDAALQYQPYMFTKAFPDQAIKPTGQGSPGWVSSPVSWSADLMAHHIVFWNAVFATIQLLIAAGLFWSRTVKLALAGSIVWAVLIWWLGEGLGGVLAGPVSPIAGLPGAVIIYALIAVFLWPGRRRFVRSVAESSPATALLAKLVWVVFWAAFAFETLRPADRSPRALRAMVAGMAAGEPAWIRSIDTRAANLLGDRGTEVSIVLAVLFAMIAASVFLTPSARRVVLIVAVVLALAIWVIGEDFGEIATGDATDPNSGPLLVLLALCFWPRRGRPVSAAGDPSDWRPAA